MTDTSFILLILTFCATITGVCAWLAVVLLSALAYHINKRLTHPLFNVVRMEVYYIKRDTYSTYRESGSLWAILSFVLGACLAVSHLIEEIVGNINHGQQPY
jgi:hypothetical protein